MVLSHNKYSLLLLTICGIVSCSKDINPFIPESGTIIDDSSSIMSPTTNDTGFNIENYIVRDYVHSISYDDDYSYTLVTNYCNSDSTLPNNSYPNIAYIAIDKEIINPSLFSQLLIEVFSNGVIFRKNVFSSIISYVPIYNLIPNRDYTYRVSYKDINDNTILIKDGHLKTIGQLRDLLIEGTDNARDIGGWHTANGSIVKYDRLFRSAELFRPGKYSITKEGINEIINNLGIDVEIDFGDYSDSSPISEYVEFVHGDLYQISSYNWELSGIADGGLIRNVFNLIVGKLSEGKKILFHCSEGCDRTGTLAFILNAILGVSESDLAKDYELSSFARESSLRCRNRNQNCYLNPLNGYPAMIAYLKDSVEGTSLQEKAINIMLGFGVNMETISLFQDLMLESTSFVK